MGREIVISTVYLNKDGIYKAKELEIVGDKKGAIDIELIFKDYQKPKEENIAKEVHVLDKNLKDIDFIIGDFLEICILEKGAQDKDERDNMSIDSENEGNKRTDVGREREQWRERRRDRDRDSDRDRNRDREEDLNRSGRGYYGERRGGGKRHHNRNDRQKQYNRRNEESYRNERDYEPRDNRGKNFYGERRHGR